MCTHSGVNFNSYIVPLLPPPAYLTSYHYINKYISFMHGMLIMNSPVMYHLMALSSTLSFLFVVIPLALT